MMAAISSGPRDTVTTVAGEATLDVRVVWPEDDRDLPQDGSATNFNHDNFINNVRSTVFLNAPAGLLYPGDEGFPDGASGYKQGRSTSRCRD